MNELKAKIEALRELANGPGDPIREPRYSHIMRYHMTVVTAWETGQLATNAPSPAPATDYNDGRWYGWNYGECPVHPRTVVEVVFTDSHSKATTADTWGWEDKHYPIIAFRVRTPYVEPPKPREFWLSLDSGSATPHRRSKDNILVREVLE